MGLRDGGGFQVVIDPAAWYRFKKELDAFDPAITRALRKRTRAAGDLGAEAVRKKLREPTESGGPNLGAGRQALIDATKVTVSFAKRAAGVRIVTSASRLPDEHKGLLRVYNKAQVRHPVYGRDVWVTQRGKPYFESEIAKLVDRELVHEINSALDEAVTAIGARGQ